MPDQLKAILTDLLSAEFMDDWELDEYTELVMELPTEAREIVLKLLPAIHPVSHALARAFLERAGGALHCLAAEQLPGWVNMVLEIYEAQGLRAAERFMLDVENNYICKIRGETGMSCDEAAGRLLPYLRGLSGRQLDLASAPVVSTDTHTVFLPPRIALCKKYEDNFIIYKLIVSQQWASIMLDSYFPDFTAQRRSKATHTWRTRSAAAVSDGKSCTALHEFLAGFANRQAALELYQLAETVRLDWFLRSELPGLMRDVAAIREQLWAARPSLATLQGTARIVEALKQWVTHEKCNGDMSPHEQLLYDNCKKLLTSLRDENAEAADSAMVIEQLYNILTPEPRDYQPGEPLLQQGRLDPVAVEEVLRKQREEAKQLFIKGLALILHDSEPADETAATGEETPAIRSPTPEADQAAIIQPGAPPEREPAPPDIEVDQTREFITIDDEHLQIPESLRGPLNDILDDFGYIPDQYISSALQQKGRGRAAGSAGPTGDGPALSGTHVYDEWDFRRAGFRKNWCQLHEKTLAPVKGTFVDRTLEKYSRLLIRLRRQFELMRTEQRFLKRQKDGDDIDFDAYIDSISNAAAGRAPSDRLFIKLRRDERNIRTVFLVDMSNSTEGWVGTAIKESLVLLCEALEMLGDQYAIYGFSGMRRLRSEIYRIKDTEEQYNDTVRGRIAAVSPREYTRMGPPIRHVTQLLSQSDAAVRLLITLSDGKPEDYDDYKGDYAVEDTRHALIEAKAAGIHPFCITIDKKAHDYISHMYGEVNYIFINDIEKLPNRIPEVYRGLTS